MAMAHNNTPPRKLWLSCGGTRCTLQALIILSTLVLLLAASTADDVVGTAEPQPPSGGGSGDCRHYRFELTHVDANLSLSSDELMRRAYDRSRLRAATLYGTAADSPAAGVGGGSSDSSSGSPARSPATLCQADSVYNIMFYMGKNRRDIISAVVDTGSDLIWTTMKECLLSSTRSVVPCSSDMCEQHANKRQCRGTCTYTITYGGDKGTKTEGILYKDKLTFLRPRPQQTFDNVAIGCSTSYIKFNDTCSIKGIVGLGRGAQSLPGQLKFDKFSYCLSSYYKPDLPSYLLLTTAPNMATGARSGAAVATTGLRRNDRYKTRYFVDLQGISINGTRLDVATKSGGGSTGGGNMFVDTGASFTELEEGVFNRLVEEVDQIMQDKQYSKLEQSQGGSICYSSSSTTARPDESMLPQMVLHFADSADMVLPWDSCLWYTSTSNSSKLCLAILKSATTGMSVLGNFQMQGIHMLFDTQNDKLSFVPADCSKV